MGICPSRARWQDPGKVRGREGALPGSGFALLPGGQARSEELSMTGGAMWSHTGTQYCRLLGDPAHSDIGALGEPWGRASDPDICPQPWTCKRQTTPRARVTHSPSWRVSLVGREGGATGHSAPFPVTCRWYLEAGQAFQHVGDLPGSVTTP